MVFGYTKIPPTENPSGDVVFTWVIAHAIVAHQTYPVKEFDGQRYVELYIPARTAIVLREKKETPKTVVEAAPAVEAAPVEEAPAEEAPPKKTTRKKTVKAEGEEAPKKTTRKKAVKAEGEEAPKKTTRTRKTTKKTEE